MSKLTPRIKHASVKEWSHVNTIATITGKLFRNLKTTTIHRNVQRSTADTLQSPLLILRSTSSLFCGFIARKWITLSLSERDTRTGAVNFVWELIRPPPAPPTDDLPTDEVLLGGACLTGFLNVGEGVVLSMGGGAFSVDLGFFARPTQRWWRMTHKLEWSTLLLCNKLPAHMHFVVTIVIIKVNSIFNLKRKRITTVSYPGNRMLWCHLWSEVWSLVS